MSISLKSVIFFDKKILAYFVSKVLDFPKFSLNFNNFLEKEKSKTKKTVFCTFLENLEVRAKNYKNESCRFFNYLQLLY